MSFGAAAAAEEEHELPGDNQEEVLGFRTRSGCQQTPALSPRSMPGLLHMGFWHKHGHNPERGTQAILPVLEYPETLPGLSPAKDSP